MTENQIASIVVDASYKIHKTLGPGLFESVYEAALEFEMRKRGLPVAHQVGLPVHYEDVKLDVGFRVDLIIDEKVIVEIKSVEALAPVHRKQLLTYLRLTELRLGLLINFNVELIRHGIQRVIKGFLA